MPNEFKIKNGFFSEGSSNVTGSLSVSGGITGSLLGTASFASTASLANSVRVFSTFTPGFYPVTFVSSSANGLLYQYQFSSFYYDPGTDTLNVSNIASSLFGTASYATQALSSSYALTASFAQTAQTASYVLNAVSASFATTAQTAQTASYVLQAVSASFATTAQTANTASYVLNAVSASYVTQALSSSFASTASYVNPLNQNILITGSATIGTSSLGPFENTLTLGARDTTSEGGQLGFNAPGGTYTSASFIDNWQNKHRILKGTNAGSNALIAQWDIHTTQLQLPAYTAASSFPGTATANLAVDSSGNVITVSTTGGTVFPYVGNAVITGSLTTTGIIYAQPNGGMYFQGGDDAALYDINVSNHMGIYGVQDSTVGAIKLGSNGPVLYGSGSKLGIGTTNPSSASLTVNGNVWATSFTGSLLGTASFATQALSSSFATTASYVLNGGVGSTFPYTGSALITGSLGITGSLVVTESGLAGINTTTSTLTDSNQSASIDWGNKWLLDSSTLLSVRWGARWLLDSSENISINWGGRTLDNSSGLPTVDWNNSILQDSSVNNSINWVSREAYDNTGTNVSIDWDNRRLKEAGGSTVLDWDLAEFYGTATNANNATTASYALTSSFVNPLNQQVVITGSLRGNVSALSISSNTASLNMSSGNFFTLNLVNGANTHINPTNLQPGQTVNIRVNQGSAGTGTVSFPSTVDQPSGSAYTGSQISNAIDIVTMITFDSSLVFVSSVRNMI